MREDKTLGKDTTWCVVCIAGIGCSGKTTLARKIQSRLPGSRIIHQDDYFRPRDYEGHVPVPGMDMSNWEVVSCVNFDRLLSDVQSILQSPARPERPVLIIEGHLVLNEARLRAMADKKICLTMGREQCWERRQRKYYGPHDSMMYFNVCAWPEYQIRLKEMTEKTEANDCTNGSDEIQFVRYDVNFDELSDEIAAGVIRICADKAKEH